MYVCTGVWVHMSGTSLQGLSLKPEFTHMASLVCKLTLGRLSNLPSTGMTTLPSGHSCALRGSQVGSSCRKRFNSSLQDWLRDFCFLAVVCSGGGG